MCVHERPKYAPALEVSAVHYVDEPGGFRIFVANRMRGAASAPFLDLEVDPGLVRLHYLPNDLENERSVSQACRLMFAGADSVILLGMQLSVAGFAFHRAIPRLPAASVVRYQAEAIDAEARSGLVEIVFERAPLSGGCG